ncbi:MAG: hypothetical protein ACKVH8_23895, partial [Pirellulales bacterium]
MRRSIKLLTTLCILLLASLLSHSTLAGEIDFIESFSLSKDRTVPLKQLIPGTEDYYYYHCLHYQNTEQFDKVDSMLKDWIKRYRYTARVNEIRNRQALLTYSKDPKASLEFIRQQLGLNFNHQRIVLDRKPNLPTELNQALISRKTHSERALRRYTNNLQGFEDRSLDWVIATPLNAEQRRDLLKRLVRPDYPN